MAQEIIKVEGMSCMHCQLRVKKAVEAVEGVQEGKVNLEEVKAAIRETGYEPL